MEVLDGELVERESGSGAKGDRKGKNQRESKDRR